MLTEFRKIFQSFLRNGKGFPLLGWEYLNLEEVITCKWIREEEIKIISILLQHFTQSGKDLVEKYSSAPYFQLVLNVTDCNCNWSKKYMQ